MGEKAVVEAAAIPDAIASGVEGDSWDEDHVDGLRVNSGSVGAGLANGERADHELGRIADLVHLQGLSEDTRIGDAHARGAKARQRRFGVDLFPVRAVGQDRAGARDLRESG